MTRTPRKAIPIGVKLQSALLALGYTEDEVFCGGIEWDHCPALALRFVDPETGELEPAPNDPRYIRPMRKADHAVKTTGRRGTSKLSASGDGDTSRAAKIKRLRGEAKGKPKRKWPSRPFLKRNKGE